MTGRDLESDRDLMGHVADGSAATPSRMVSVGARLEGLTGGGSRPFRRESDGGANRGEVWARFNLSRWREQNAPDHDRAFCELAVDVVRFRTIGSEMPRISFRRL
jgi:hypothetical protein